MQLRGQHAVSSGSGISVTSPAVYCRRLLCVFFRPFMQQLFLWGKKSLRLDKMHRLEIQNEIISSSNVASHISQDIKFHLFIFCRLELIQSLLPLDLFQQIQWILIQALNQALTLYIFDYWKDSNPLLPPCVLIQRPHFPLANSGTCHSAGNMLHFKSMQSTSVFF